MADIYLYVPCNGTRYYTSPDVTSSEFVVYGNTQLDSHKSYARIYTNYTDKALIIKNNSNNSMSWDYTVEWWQRKSQATSAAAVMMLSAERDNVKLQLQDRMDDGDLNLTFENRTQEEYDIGNLSDTISDFNNEEWTHFAYVFNSTLERAYYFINGIFKKAIDISFPDNTPQYSMYMLCVGAKSSDLTYASEFFNGDISDVVVYNGIKYQEEETFIPPVKSPDTTGLIAYGIPSYTDLTIKKYYASKENEKFNLVKMGSKKYLAFVLEQPTSIEDYIISEDLVLNAPLDLPNKNIIINSNVTISVQEPMMPLIINCYSLTNNGTITVNGKGWQTSRNGYEDANYSVIKGYVKGGYNYGHTTFAQYTSAQQIGGGAPDDTKDFARRTMLGLQNATPGLFRGCDGVGACGPGYAGTLGGGGGAGCDGNAGNGGGSGSGGGGGASGGGSYNGPTGGDGSQADEVTNTSLFKQNKFSEIPMFGGAGGTVYLKQVGLNLSYTDGGGNIQIYARNIINNGTISANAVTTNNNPNNARNSGNGGGGGGCIMLRYNTYTNNGTVQALGESGLINYDGYYGGHGGNGLILLDDTNYSVPEKYVVNFSNFNGEIEISENNTYPKTIINNGNIKVYKGSFISYTYNGTTNYTYITQDNMIITP